MGYWEINRSRDVEKFWNKLSELTIEEQAAYNEADELLRSDPYPGNHPIGVVSHLKGANSTVTTSTVGYLIASASFTRC